MENEYAEGVTSTASIARHPIHPILVPFPIAFLVGALVTDLAYWRTSDAFWAQASYWLVLAGALSTGFAAIFGLTDFLTIRRARAHLDGWIHLIGNVIVLVLAIVSWLMRRADAAAAVLPWGLLISAVVSVLLLITGWYGGELAYRYKIGVVGRRERELSEVTTGQRRPM
jgi:uncharacterized membrane protein